MEPGDPDRGDFSFFVIETQHFGRVRWMCFMEVRDPSLYEKEGHTHYHVDQGEVETQLERSKLHNFFIMTIFNAKT